MNSTQRSKGTVTKMTQTTSQAPVATEGKRTRTKKADMPYHFKFLNAKSEESDSIPVGVTTIKMVLSNGKALTVDLKGISAETSEQLKADALRRKLNVACKELTKDTLDQVPGIVDSFTKALKANQLYVPAERGGGPGRVFDFDHWVEVSARFAKHRVEAKIAKAKLMTEADRKAFRAKLEAMSPDERKALKEGVWEKNPVIKKISAALKLEKDTQKAENLEMDMMG